MARKLNVIALFSEHLLPEVRSEWEIEIPPGVSLASLHASPMGRAFMCPQDWYKTFDWYRAELPHGIHKLRLPVPDSNNKTRSEQKALLLPGEIVAPVGIVAAAMLCMRQTCAATDPCKDGWIRCAETFRRFHVALYWYAGRLNLDRNLADHRDASIWISAIQML